MTKAQERSINFCVLLLSFNVIYVKFGGFRSDVVQSNTEPALLFLMVHAPLSDNLFRHSSSPPEKGKKKKYKKKAVKAVVFALVLNQLYIQTQSNKNKIHETKNTQIL